jgi:hypothetical protein
VQRAQKQSKTKFIFCPTKSTFQNPLFTFGRVGSCLAVATLRGSLFAQPCGLLLRSTTPHRSRSPAHPPHQTDYEKAGTSPCNIQHQHQAKGLIMSQNLKKRKNVKNAQKTIRKKNNMFII